MGHRDGSTDTWKGGKVGRVESSDDATPFVSGWATLLLAWGGGALGRDVGMRCVFRGNSRWMVSSMSATWSLS